VNKNIKIKPHKTGFKPSKKLITIIAAGVLVAIIGDIGIYFAIAPHASYALTIDGIDCNAFEQLLFHIHAANFGWASKDNLKKFASQTSGIDMQKFNSCFDTQKYLSFVQKDFAFATSLGLQGTPTFVIEKSDGSNSQTLPGVYPFPSFKAIIDKNIGSA
jgi:protein-disulfide isomerase